MTCSVPGYQVERLLGSGGQGEVWLGRAEAGGERVALKCIRTPTAAAAAAARREAALLAVLDHPSLIELRDFVPLDGSVVLVLELAEAGTLASLLRRRDRLTPAETVAAISPVAAALAHAHETGVLHGDVSPANILFTVAGYPKLADLGVARMLAGPDQRLGTPAYLDPAIAAGGAAVPASDVFSVAAVALHALTGSGPWQRPGSASSADQVLAVAAAGHVLDLAERLNSVPPGIAKALVRALDADPAQRGTAAELALDLRAALPPKPVVLAGGRIAERTGRHAADRRPERPAQAAVAAQDRSIGQGGAEFWDPSMTGPRFVPADLTRITPPRDRGVVESLRLGGLTADPTGRDPEVSQRRTTIPFRRLMTALAGAVGGLHSIRRRSPRPLRSPLSPRSRWLSPRSPRTSSDRVPGPFGRRLLGRVKGLTVAIVLLLLGIGVTGLRSHGRVDASVANVIPGAARSHGGGAGPGTGRVTASGGGAATAATRVPPQPPAARAGVVTGRRAAQILTALDEIRERAYARRDAGLLSRVYAAPGLLAADVAELGRSVPDGCGLFGVRTSYHDVRVIAAGAGDGSPSSTAAVSNAAPEGHLDPGGLVIEASAALPSSTLTCGGTARTRVSATGPVRLRVVLTRDGAGYRIASQRLA